MNPYPYFDDRWNQILAGCCMANIVAVLMPFLLPPGAVDLRQLTNPSWILGPKGVAILFLFAACLLGTLILWLNMWMYWARAGRPVLWMLLLIFGAWGPAIAFFFLVYRKDLEAFKLHDAEERRNLTHF